MPSVTFYSNDLGREIEVESINFKANTFVVRPYGATVVLDGADKLIDRTLVKSKAEGLKKAIKIAGWLKINLLAGGDTTGQLNEVHMFANKCIDHVIAAIYGADELNNYPKEPPEPSPEMNIIDEAFDTVKGLIDVVDSLSGNKDMTGADARAAIAKGRAFIGREDPDEGGM